MIEIIEKIIEIIKFIIKKINGERNKKTILKLLTSYKNYFLTEDKILNLLSTKYNYKSGKSYMNQLLQELIDENKTYSYNIQATNNSAYSSIDSIFVKKSVKICDIKYKYLFCIINDVKEFEGFINLGYIQSIPNDKDKILLIPIYIDQISCIDEKTINSEELKIVKDYLTKIKLMN